MRFQTLCFITLALFAATECSRAEADKSQPTASEAPRNGPETKPKSEPEATAVVPVKPAQQIELEIASVANTMAFDKKTLTVPSAAVVHLVFKNNATMETLPHNWVLVRPGTEASVAAAGLKLGEPAGYLDVRDKDALVHTPMAKPGQSSEVTFTAPDPGAYPFICTVPGHYMMMKGVLTVTP